MRMFEWGEGGARLAAYAAVSLTAVLLAGPTAAFDGRQTSGSSQQVMQQDEPDEVLQRGLNFYYQGDKKEALLSLETAATLGHPIAQWKLGRMYADGDGVKENDLRAFELFSQIANEHAEDQPNSSRAPFVSDAFVALGYYYKNGIANSAVTPNPVRARQMFQFAASYFRDPEAQYQLGRMYDLGEGGVERNGRSAARWLNLSAHKGHIGAQLELGELLTTGSDELPVMAVAGLKWLTIALEQCQGSCPDYQRIQSSHERAFVAANAEVRQEAIGRAEDWLLQRGQRSGQITTQQSVDLGSSRQLQ